MSTHKKNALEPTDLSRDNEHTQTFYVTTASNHPRGPGYWEVHAKDMTEAREITVRELGRKWSFMYRELSEVHPIDRKKHGELS